MAAQPKLNGHRIPPKARRVVASAPVAASASTSDKITAERVVMSLRTRFDPLPSLNPQLLVRYLQQFEYGYLELAARTWDAMERRDDRLASVASKAKSALARYGFEVVVSSDVPEAQKAEAAKHKAALEYLFGNCTATNAVREDETGGFSLLVRQMADAIGKRYSVHEIVWEPDGAGQLTATFRHAPLWFFEATTGKLRFKLQDGVALGEPMDPDAWLVTVGEGIMEACSVLWIYKHLPLRDWLAYSEKFGMPYLLGKTQAIFNSAEWQAMVAALRGFGNDGAAVVGGADDIVPVKVGGGSETTPFPGIVERSERAMSILWRGADLGTQAHSGAGKGQGASLQADETSALDEDRAAWLTESLIPVSRTAIKYLFGQGVKPLAFVRIKTEVKRDIQLDLAVDTFLLSNGAPVSIADTLERYSRPTPGPDEPLLKPPVAAAAGAAKEDESEATIERAANERAVEIVTQLRADEAAAKLQSAALRQFAEGAAKDFAPVRERLLLIAENDDPATMQAALVKLRRDLPGMLTAMNVRPAQVKPLADAMAASLFNGVVTGAVQTHQADVAAENANPYHDKAGRFTSRGGAAVPQFHLSDEHWSGSPKEMHDRADATMKGFGDVRHPHLGTVRFTAQGRNKTLFDKRAPHEFQSVQALPEMVAGGKWTKSEPDRKGRQEVSAFHTLHAGLQIGSSHYGVEMTIKQLNDGSAAPHRFYLHRLE